MTAEQWAEIERLMPRKPPGTPGRKYPDFRPIVEEMERRWRTGGTYRAMGFPRSTVNEWARRWLADGTLDRIRAILGVPDWRELRPTT